jgi:hypothetical protein
MVAAQAAGNREPRARAGCQRDEPSTLNRSPSAASTYLACRCGQAVGTPNGVGRQRPTTGLTEGMVLGRLAVSDDDLAARALRRHRAWREAVERGASAKAQRSLRRAWERARDEALIALSAGESPSPSASTRSNTAPLDQRALLASASRHVDTASTA